MSNEQKKVPVTNGTKTRYIYENMVNAYSGAGWYLVEQQQTSESSDETINEENE